VKLTPDGKAKVLDFGLAKAWTGEGAAGTSSGDPSESPTREAREVPVGGREGRAVLERQGGEEGVKNRSRS
jgi:hypothetical protein